MKHSAPLLAAVWLAILALAAPLAAGGGGPEPSSPVTLSAPEFDPWEWILPKRRGESCQALTTCACVPDTSSAWCIQMGLSCTDASGYECQWPPRRGGTPSR